MNKYRHAILLLLGAMFAIGQQCVFAQSDFATQPKDMLNAFDQQNNHNESHQFRSGWKSDYKSEDFNYDRVTAMPNAPEDLDYDDYESEQLRNTNSPSSSFEGIGTLLMILGYIVLAVVIGFVIYAFMQNGGIRSKGLGGKASEYEVLEEDLNFEEADYITLAKRAKADGLLKLAIRYYFLAYLQQLNHDKYIEFHIDKTNLDYKYEIADVHLRNDFTTLSRVFDYCWYGEHNLSNEQFSNAEQLFMQKIQK
jgi:hypothetical protein